MSQSVFTSNDALSGRLAAGIRNAQTGSTPLTEPVGKFPVVARLDDRTHRGTTVEVVVTPNEINDKHGTGPLIRRILAGQDNILSIRSGNYWGEQTFGAWHVLVSQQNSPRVECFRNVLDVLAGCKVRRVLCVPYLLDDAITAIAVQECFEADLCTWIMDDQNIVDNAIPDVLMFELLQKSRIRFTTHPELRHLYERKFGLQCYILPAIVPDQLILTDIVPPAVYSGGAVVGALLGSFWDQRWFDNILTMLRNSSVRLDWYGNHHSPLLKYADGDLMNAGIVPHGVIPEADLCRELRKYPFVVVPAAALDGSDFNPGVARLSLPGRIPFAIAVAHVPVLLVGSDDTCGARFIRHFGLGEVVPYDALQFSAAVQRLVDPEIQMTVRKNARRIAKSLSDHDIPAWYQTSMSKGSAADDRFETLFAGYDPALPNSSGLNIKSVKGARR